MIAASAPKALFPVMGSSLVVATLIALGLNLLFRLGVRRTLAIRLEPENWSTAQIDETVQRQGATWGARPDIISHASWAISEDEIMSSEDGVRRLAGYMLRRIADRARSELRNGRPILRLHFDH